MAKKKKARKKKRSSRKKQPRQKSIQQNTPIPRKQSLLKRIWRFFWLGSCGISVFVGIYVFFYPYVSVSTGKSLDPLRPFSNPFVVSNDGFITLTDLDFDLTIPTMVDIYENAFSNVFFSGLTKHVEELQPRKKHNIFLDHAVASSPGQIKSAEIHVQVLFRPKIPPLVLPFRLNREFSFKVFRTSSGQYRWLEYDIEK